jgi:hypothetical protein
MEASHASLCRRELFLVKPAISRHAAGKAANESDRQLRRPYFICLVYASSDAKTARVTGQFASRLTFVEHTPLNQIRRYRLSGCVNHRSSSRC